MPVSSNTKRSSSLAVGKSVIRPSMSKSPALVATGGAGLTTQSVLFFFVLVSFGSAGVAFVSSQGFSGGVVVVISFSFSMRYMGESVPHVYLVRVNYPCRQD